MPLQTPSSIRTMMQKRAQVARQSNPRPSPSKSLLQRILPAKIARTINYARNNPLRVAEHSLPFGLGALFGLSGEARLVEEKNAMMIAWAKNSTRRPQNAAPSPELRAQPPLPQNSAPYRSLAGQRASFNAPQPKTFANLPRKQPPVSSRFVARKASSRISSEFPTTIAAWVQNRARKGSK